MYDGLKAKLAKDKDLAQQLQDPNLNPAQKQDMLNEVTFTVMKELGYVANDTKLLATNEKGANNTQIKGHYGENNVNYVNDIYNQSTTELLESLGHEMTHAMDNQDGTLKLNDTDQNNYANNFGDDLAFYTGNALDYTNGSSLAPTNNHNQEQVTSKPSIFNTLDRNNAEFIGLDKTGGDDLSIHAPGTFSDKKDADKEFIAELSKMLQDKVIVMDNGKKLENNDGARQEFAKKVIDKIKNHDFKDGEPLNLSGHSHGGNVQKIVTQLLEEEGIVKKVDGVYLFGTPVRDD